MQAQSSYQSGLQITDIGHKQPAQAHYGVQTQGYYSYGLGYTGPGFGEPLDYYGSTSSA